ncbi:VPS10 [Symbiodinium natans]|uniref:VPS10 protein n=1 Tax=Symbiodinium natans TaxID=878477 RepID=A0A812IB45_9DINO|nr:VPS10 [Symbiodinium natans]
MHLLALHAMRTLLMLLVVRSAAGSELPALKMSTFDAQIVDILWLGPDRKKVLLNTKRGTVYESLEDGRDWEKKPVHPALQVARLIMSAADSSTVVAVGYRLEVFASLDAGENWHEVVHPPGVRLSFMFHPTQPSWALLSVWTDECRLTAPGSPCSHKLLVTEDLGNRPLVPVAEHVVQFSWGRGAVKDRIFFTHIRDKSKRQSALSKWMEGVDFVSVAVSGDKASQSLHVQGGNKFVISEQYILVAQVKDVSAQTVNLKVSKDSTTFQQAVLPTELDEKSYTVLDASESEVVLHVNHGNGLGNIYVSDESGTRYILSLEHNVGLQGHAAFEKVTNLNGIYFANVWAATDKPAGKHDPVSPTWLDHADYQLGEDSTQSQTERSIRYLKARTEQTEARQLHRRLESSNMSIRSRISFDAGGNWVPLRPPSKDSLGTDITCQGCALHLHDATFQDKFVPFYSYDKAIGIIMGVGNVGPQLSFEPQEANTYLSRDGGFNWLEVKKGVHIYEFGNHGAVLVMADILSETDAIIYSMDEGNSWKTLHLSSKMNVTNILIEPRAIATKFLAYGSVGGAGVVQFLDFDALGWMPCRKPNAPGSDASDYEAWSPLSDESAHTCLLGQKTTYVRRKRLSECFNRRESKLPVISTPCPCTRDDFECNLGFQLALDSKSCVKSELPLIGDIGEVQGEPAQCQVSESYVVDMYRRVPGDRCLGGWAPPQFEMKCKDRQSAGSWSVTRLVLLLLAIAGLVFVARSERFQDWWEALANRSDRMEHMELICGQELPGIPRYRAPSVARVRVHDLMSSGERDTFCTEVLVQMSDMEACSFRNSGLSSGAGKEVTIAGRGLRDFAKAADVISKDLGHMGLLDGSALLELRFGDQGGSVLCCMAAGCDDTARPLQDFSAVFMVSTRESTEPGGAAAPGVASTASAAASAATDPPAAATAPSSARRPQRQGPKRRALEAASSDDFGAFPEPNSQAPRSEARLNVRKGRKGGGASAAQSPAILIGIQGDHSSATYAAARLTDAGASPSRAL